MAELDSATKAMSTTTDKAMTTTVMTCLDSDQTCPEPMSLDHACTKRKNTSEDPVLEKIRKTYSSPSPSDAKQDENPVDNRPNIFQAGACGGQGLKTDSESQSELSDASHHTKDLGYSPIEASSADDDDSDCFHEVVGKKKLKFLSRTQVTSAVHSPSHSMTSHVPKPQCKQNTRAPISSEYQSEKSASQQNKFSRYQSPKPTFCQYPVIVEDKFETEEVRLWSLSWKLADIIQVATSAPVRTVKPLSKAKILVGCSSSRQQQRLLQMSTLGGISVACKVPSPCVEGVLNGIPLGVSDDELLESIDHVLDEEGKPSSASVKKVSRMAFKDGKMSTSFRISFFGTNLPASIIVCRQEFVVRPYVAQVTRCFKCHRFGHVIKDCKASQETCSNCGVQGHTKASCNASQVVCVNCKGNHSAGYRGCPTRKTWSLANKLRAQTYMPKSQALQEAKASTVITQPSHPTGSTPGSAWKQEQSSIRSFAAVAGCSKGSKGKDNALVHKEINDPVLNSPSVRDTYAQAFSSVVGSSSVVVDTVRSKKSSGFLSSERSTATSSHPDFEALLQENQTLQAEVSSLKDVIKSLEKSMDSLRKQVLSVKKSNESKFSENPKVSSPQLQLPSVVMASQQQSREIICRSGLQPSTSSDSRDSTTPQPMDTRTILLIESIFTRMFKQLWDSGDIKSLQPKAVQ